MCMYMLCVGRAIPCAKSIHLNTHADADDDDDHTHTTPNHSFAWKRKKAEQQALCGLDETGRPLRALGGKRDDITVVVARVSMR